MAGVAIDIGGHSIKSISVKAGKHGVQVLGFSAVPTDCPLYTSDDSDE